MDRLQKMSHIHTSMNFEKEAILFIKYMHDEYTNLLMLSWSIVSCFVANLQTTMLKLPLKRFIFLHTKDNSMSLLKKIVVILSRDHTSRYDKCLSGIIEVCLCPRNHANSSQLQNLKTLTSNKIKTHEWRGTKWPGVIFNNNPLSSTNIGGLHFSYFLIVL